MSDIAMKQLSLLFAQSLAVWVDQEGRHNSFPGIFTTWGGHTQAKKLDKHKHEFVHKWVLTEDRWPVAIGIDVFSKTFLKLNDKCTSPLTFPVIHSTKSAHKKEKNLRLAKQASVHTHMKYALNSLTFKVSLLSKSCCLHTQKTGNVWGQATVWSLAVNW